MKMTTTKKVIGSSAAQTHSQRTKALRGRLLQCAAVSAAAWAAVTSPAHAAIPPECDVDGDLTNATITCQVPDPDALEAVTVLGDNQAVIIGSADVPTTLQTADPVGIGVNGGGNQSVIIASGSSVESISGSDIEMSTGGINGFVLVNAQGPVTGRTNGIVASNLSDGNSNIQVDAVTGNGEDGIFLQHFSTGVAIIDADGPISGGTNGVRIETDATSGQVRVSASQTIQGGETGVLIARGGAQTDTSASLVDVAGGSIGVLINGGSGNTNLELSGRISGEEIGALVLGIGSLDVSLNDVESGGSGVQILTDADGSGEMRFASDGTIAGDDVGIFAIHAGAGKRFSMSTTSNPPAARRLKSRLPTPIRPILP